MPDSDRDPFAALPPGLRPLAQRGVIKAFRKGERLIEEGRYGDELYIILTGHLRAFARNDKGREITYGVHGPGEYIGEMSLDGGPRSATVVALEASRCAMVARQTLLQHIGEHPEFAMDLIAKLIRRARSATLSARQLALNDAYGRLKLMLESLAEPQTDGTSIVMQPLSHRDMANGVGSSREMVSRLIKDLREGGYLTESTRGLVLRNLPGRW